MPIAFITGATGFLGRHICDVLNEQGWEIHALVRDERKAGKLLGDKIHFIKGDLTLASSYRELLPTTIDCIFHIAADTSTWKKEAARQEKINVEGTAALLQLCQDVKAKRFIHVSSISVFGIHKELVREQTTKLGKDSWVSYVRTKTVAERKVAEAAARGTDAVIVNPTHIVGRYDDHNWSRMIQMMHQGTLPGVPPGAGNFANGRAVAEAIVAAYEKGRKGESYILGGPYASMRDFLVIAAKELGLPEPKKPSPAFLLVAFSRLLSALSFFTGKRPMLTPEEAYFACETVDASSEKAIKELGFQEVPLEQSVKESIAYLKEQKLI
ncbi:MAG: NAD-dependent epimerase/dehydratase family protein [Alphaproteobacteria bacterium]|nr:NAD-dependent epimerase/dehydratase family protein [Alphaproteobacteria bacterium]